MTETESILDHAICTRSCTTRYSEEVTSLALHLPCFLLRKPSYVPHQLPYLVSSIFLARPSDQVELKPMKICPINTVPRGKLRVFPSSSMPQPDTHQLFTSQLINSAIRESFEATNFPRPPTPSLSYLLHPLLGSTSQIPSSCPIPP